MQDLKKEKDILKSLLSSGYTDEELLNLIISVTYASESANNDLYVISKYLKDDDIKNLVFNLSGKKLQLPTIDDYYKSTIISLCFYLLEIKNMTWDEIKEIIRNNNPILYDNYFNTIDIGKRISKIKKFINKELFELIAQNKKEGN
jgi:hypothetical protein